MVFRGEQVRDKTTLDRSEALLTIGDGQIKVAMSTESEITRVVLLDATGRKRYNRKVNGNHTTMPNHGSASGFLIMRLYAEEGLHSLKLR